MESYLIYIGKAALAAGAFYLAYLTLFQNRKQFVFNRIYLPVSLALSFIIPLITFTTVKYIEAPAADANSFAFLSQATTTAETYSESPSLWPHYLFGMYLLGIAGFLFHLLAGHFNAIRMVQKSRIKNLFGSRVHITKKDVHPFSFFNKIVLSENTLNSPNLEMIVAHESIHVKEKHTLDILFTEILFLLQWFNPFAWLIKDAVKNNLEYKTDDKIVKTNDPQTYQLAMVALADKKGVAPFLTALNGSQLKNRIIMMKKKTENKFALLKQLVLLPLLAVLVMGLAEREVRTEFINPDKKDEFHVTHPGKYTIADIEISGIQNPDRTALIQLSGLELGETIEIPGKDINNAVKKLWQQELFSDVKITASKIVGDDIWIDIFLQEQNKKDEFHVTHPGKYTIADIEISGIQNPDRTALIQLSGLEVGETIEIPGEAINNAVKKLWQQELFSDVKITASKIVGDDIWLDIFLQEQNKTVELADVEQERKTVKGKVTDKEGNPIKEANILIVSSQNTVETDSNGDFKIQLDTENEKLVFGKSGYKTLEIKTTGKSNLDVQLETENRLYIVDGKELQGSIDDLNPDDIKSIDVLKGESAAQHFGEKGINGVILIQTKNGVNKSLQGKIDISKPESNQNISNMRLRSPSGSEFPLFILDGKEVPNIDDVSPEAIESINVLKGESATGLYGEKGKDGVIVITSKKFAEQNKITTELELRQFIAKSIKYPVEAQEANKTGVVQLFIELNNSGQVMKILEKASEDELFLDEVVVVAYKNKDEAIIEDNLTETGNSALKDEVKRIIRQLPKIEMPEYEGKTVGITVKFMLQ